ncbi:DNA cytosine methyltransferase [uncultured Propionibacterium sp.]|uniref:DNA cytosine methyltransferase n=1 Tax=uncultured Propionibacterium sp. TaxID=218066 RepID=UPI00292E7C27|nr:DNA cytosine methyltransferase [uncultured Propionibacterium sp.]
MDLFCGAGGLSYGLMQAGIEIRAGIDVNPQCRYPFETNLGATFYEMSVRDISAHDIQSMWSKGSARLLAGCAPCQPFSSQRRGADSKKHSAWNLLLEFGRLAQEIRPEYLTMENVAPLRKQEVFHHFLKDLSSKGYYIDYDVLKAEQYGLPQRRRRLVLIASRKGPIALPKKWVSREDETTVVQALAGLPPLQAGEVDPDDPLHRARKLSPINVARIRASKPGGTWEDWPEELRAPCHTRSSGKSFGSFYGVMNPGEPAPTITTEFFNYGSGRFGHPYQSRTITPREAAILQGFPRDYSFIPPNNPAHFTTLGKMIGNAVPPVLGFLVGKRIIEDASNHD